MIDERNWRPTPVLCWEPATADQVPKELFAVWSGIDGVAHLCWFGLLEMDSLGLPWFIHMPSVIAVFERRYMPTSWPSRKNLDGVIIAPPRGILKPLTQPVFPLCSIGRNARRGTTDSLRNPANHERGRKPLEKQRLRILLYRQLMHEVRGERRCITAVYVRSKLRPIPQLHVARNGRNVDGCQDMTGAGTEVTIAEWTVAIGMGAYSLFEENSGAK